METTSSQPKRHTKKSNPRLPPREPRPQAQAQPQLLNHHRETPTGITWSSCRPDTQGASARAASPPAPAVAVAVGPTAMRAAPRAALSMAAGEVGTHASSLLLDSALGLVKQLDVIVSQAEARTLSCIVSLLVLEPTSQLVWFA